MIGNQKKRKMRKKPKNTSFHGLAIQILEKEGGAMKVKEITRKILETKKVNGKTPHATVSTVLQRSKYVERVGVSWYKLVSDD